MDLIFWPAYVVLGWNGITTAASNTSMRFGMTVGCGFLAYVLYEMRGFAPKIYSQSEIIVGLAMCWLGLHPSQSSPSPQASLLSSDQLIKALAVIGGIYVIVRGLDNYHKEAKSTKNEASKTA
jgi:hypothetical protein